MVKPNSEGLFLATEKESGVRTVVNVFKDEDEGFLVENPVYGVGQRTSPHFVTSLDEYCDWEEIPALSDEVRGTLPDETLADLPDGYYYDRRDEGLFVKVGNNGFVIAWSNYNGKHLMLNTPEALGNLTDYPTGKFQPLSADEVQNFLRVCAIQ